MTFEFSSDNEVLTCRILRSCDVPPAAVKDLCGKCARELGDDEPEGAVEPISLEERASCDRCGHLSGYGKRLERLRLERERSAEAADERERMKERTQFIGFKRRPRVPDPSF